MYPPFSGYMDANGDIFGRGTQDTKDVGVQYMEVLRKFKKDNITLARTIHLTVMPGWSNIPIKRLLPLPQLAI